jgi:hypothetical protein
MKKVQDYLQQVDEEVKAAEFAEDWDTPSEDPD